MSVTPERIRSHAHAADTLPDAPYVAYALIQAAKLLTALLVRRWPHLG